MGASMHLTAASKQKLNALMKEMQKTTGAEMEKVIRNTARDLVREAIKITPKAEQGLERWVQIDPDYRTGEDGKPIYMPARKLKPKYRGKSRKLKVTPGLARSGWSGALNRLGVSRRAGKSGMKFSEVKKYNYNKMAGLLVSNSIPFIENLDKGNYKNGYPAHILERAMRAVNMKTEKRLQDMARRVIKRSVGV